MHPGTRTGATTTINLSIAPQYDWNRIYLAAKDIEEFLPYIPLEAAVVQPTEDGFDVKAPDDTSMLVHVVVSTESHQPLRVGDPVVITTYGGAAVEGDLLREGRLGEWVVRTRSAADGTCAERTVPASDISFSWRVGRNMWMQAVRLAPLRAAACKINWLGLRSLEPDSEATMASDMALAAGDPAALFGLTGGESELNGQVRRHCRVSSRPTR